MSHFPGPWLACTDFHSWGICGSEAFKAFHATYEVIATTGSSSNKTWWSKCDKSHWGLRVHSIQFCKVNLRRKHKWTDCVSRFCKVSFLVVHHIDFHSLEPLSRQRSASHKDSFINTFAGFSSSLPPPPTNAHIPTRAHTIRTQHIDLLSAHIPHTHFHLPTSPNPVLPPLPATLYIAKTLLILTLRGCGTNVLSTGLAATSFLSSCNRLSLLRCGVD